MSSFSILVCRVLFILAVSTHVAKSFAVGARRIGIVPCCHQRNPLPRQPGCAGPRNQFMPRSATELLGYDYFQEGSREVYQAFQSLENSISLSNADVSLQQSERREILKTMPRQRYPIAEFAKNMLTGPLQLSSVAASLFKVLPVDSVSNIIGKVSSLHFWIAIVVAPLYLRLAMRGHGKEALETKQQLPRLGQPRETPQRLCNNHVLCLTEQWCSAVIGVLCFGHFVSDSTRVPVRIATRLAAFLSLHQFPKLWFEFQRESQPRPLTRWKMILTLLVNVMTTRWFLALDVAQWAYAQSWRTLLSVYGTLWLAFALATYQWPPPPTTNSNATTSEKPAHEFQPAKLLQRYRVIIGSSVAACFALGPCLTMIRDSLLWIRMSSTSAISQCFIQSAAAGLALLGPIGHVVGFRRVLKVLYTHDLPLTLRPQEFADKAKQRSLYKWRFRLDWREPKRIGTVVDQIVNGLLYSLFISGDVEEQLWQEKHARMADELKARRYHVLQRVEYDMKYRSGDPQASTNLMSKTEAMDRVKLWHNESFPSIDDPIGQALYKTFDIGLGFEFANNMNKTLGQHPTGRELQLHAAITAMRRARQLYNQTAEMERLQSISDPIARERKVKELGEKKQHEMQYMRDRLIELVPTDFSSPEQTFPIEKMSALMGRQQRDPVVEALLNEGRQILEGRVEIDYLNPSGEEDRNVTADHDLEPPAFSNSSHVNETYVDLRDPLSIEANDGFNDIQLC